MSKGGGRMKERRWGEMRETGREEAGSMTDRQNDKH